MAPRPPAIGVRALVLWQAGDLGAEQVIGM
jgi:hypothetical protein